MSGLRERAVELKGSIDSRGYRRVMVRTVDGPRMRLVHRLIALTFLPNPECHPDVAHLNGKPGDDQASNLAWMSHQDNQRMMLSHGTQSVTCKLTAKQVHYIREMVAAGPRGTMRRLAQEFGVQPSAITRIVNGQRWKVDW